MIRGRPDGPPDLLDGAEQEFRPFVPEFEQQLGKKEFAQANHARPTLTTISQHPTELGHRAFMLLTEMIETPPEDRLCSRHIRLPVEVVVRESTGK